jgi:protein-tyrosine-phosphatase
MANTPETPPSLVTLLADPTVWGIIVHLAQSDAHQNELAQALHQSPEEITTKAALLYEMKLVGTRQSDSNPNRIFYRLDLAALRDAWNAAGTAIHPFVGGVEDNLESLRPKLRVLFLCTHNSARSQMAEAMLRHFSKGKVLVYSAGSVATQIHPLAIETMAQAGIDMSNQRSKHMDEFKDEHVDYVITVCDQQHETCPVFPGTPQRLHWSFADPSAETTEDARRQAFKSVANQMRNLIRYFLIMLERSER